MFLNSSIKLCVAATMLACALSANAAVYDYRTEGFEDSQWTTKGATVTSSTGTWTTNKNVAVTSECNSGSQALFMSAKAGIVTPELTKGAGTLIYYAKDSNRQVSVEVSSDNSTWTTVESYKNTTDWTRHMVTINDETVRYIKFSTTSNNNFWLDDILVTLPDGTDGDGNVIVSNLTLPYFVQDFETTSQYPSSKPSDSTEQVFNVEGQGEWIYSNAYRSTNADYITDGSKSALRMLKNGSYVITPVLSQGVVKITLNEGRAKQKALSIYTSTDEGATWTLAASPLTDKAMSVAIGMRDVNRLKIQNDEGSDVDVDNICVTAFPEGTIATVVTGEASDVTASTAKVAATLSDAGDRNVIERGVCWSIDETPSIDANAVAAKGTALGDYSVTLTNLPAKSTVNYRAYALSLAGVAYGEVKNFTTSSASLATLVITSIEQNDELTNEELVYLTVTANVQDNGGAEVEAAGVCYTTDSTEPSIDTNSLRANVEKAATDFSVNLPLQPQTEYNIRAWVRTEAGIAYSETKTVTTSEIVIPEYAHNIYYCSPDGDDTTADGSEEKPFYSLQKAVDLVQAGDAIYMAAGTYKYSSRINVSAVGAKDSGMIQLKSVGGRAVLDFSEMSVADANQGMRLCGSYWHIYGIDFCNAGDNGLLIERNKPNGGNYSDIAANVDQAHHNIIELCKFYRNSDTGLQMKNLAAYNMVINCDSYYNADPDLGDADGFAVKLSHGEGNYFYGCRSWSNSDDGWDQYIKSEGGFPDDITTTIENCWAFNNGFLEDGNAGTGNGNGFKMGSDEGRNNVILNRCLSFNNLQKGFDQNHNTGNMILNNCTGYAEPYTSNSSHFTYRIDETVAANHVIRLTNCVAISDGITDRKKSAYAPISVSGEQITCDFLTLPEDYQSIDPTGMDGERNEDGSLPELPFMKIREGNAKLIDCGTEVYPFAGESVWSNGIQYNGIAPDLGCFETEATSTGIANLAAADKSGRLTVTRAECGLLFITISGTSSTDVNTLNVIDMNGRTVRKLNVSGSTAQLNLAGVNPGLYIIRLNDTNATIKVRK